MTHSQLTVEVLGRGVYFLMGAVVATVAIFTFVI
jgi:hypothetical protein